MSEILKKDGNYSAIQSKFYDVNPPLVPWPEILISKGFSLLYKPRELFWKREIDKLNLKFRERVLEVGCGQGIFLKRIAKTYGVCGVGIDVSKKEIEYASKSHMKNVEFFVGDALKLPFQNDSFSVVISFDLLEHIENQNKAIDEMIRVLKPEGRLMIYSLNKNYKYSLDWLWEKLGFDIFARAAHKKKLFVDVAKLRKKLEGEKAAVEELKLFDAFFTLACDEVIMMAASILGKFGFYKSEFLGNIFLGLTNILSKLLFPILNLMDHVWVKQGYSLSFIIIAKKYVR